MELISLILNLLLGGGIITLLTMRATKKKANAEAVSAVAQAESSELDNVEKAIKIWREMAESSVQKYDKLADEVSQLKRTVDKLNQTNSKILKLLEKISPDNIEGPVQQIKDEINNVSV